ncbi:portal protein [Rhizobacter sp. Root404]|uniref:portal protein n=1 Tax=Rhizobacter sp. Root404 TaxID=1736528 RepID=UPI0006FAEE6D|nr:portal protein [Rhizobacter sp. Root404]KQW36751.1 hypothetical protein ASC76_19130 [Rhizobacter sp. Root404]
MEIKTTAKARYQALEAHRRPYLDRGRRNVKLCIPSLLPPEGYNGSTDLDEPYQSVGSTGHSHLASKLTMTLLPANSGFFKLQADIAELRKEGLDQAGITEIDSSLGESEQYIQTAMSSGTLRAKVTESLLHIFAVGSNFMHVTDPANVVLYRLDQYVVRRARKGRLLEFVLFEELDIEELTAEERAATDLTQHKGDQPLEMYTWGKLRDGKMEVHKEVNGKLIPGTEETFPEDECPYIALRFRSVDGEHYSRSLIDEVYGDLNALDGLSQALLEGSLMASKVIWLVNPGVTTKLEDLVQARNGSFIYGNAGEVQALQMQKHADFATAAQHMAKLEQRLAMAFLMSAAVQRDGERVTAEEIRTMARELEDGLGGLYSLLSQELQLPLVRIVMSLLKREKRLPQYPKHVVKPQIVTGIEALGRGHDADKLREFLSEIVQLPGAAERLNIGEIITRLATAGGVSTENLVRSDQEIAAERQKQMMEQAAMNVGQQVGPGLIQGAMAQAQAPAEPQAEPQAQPA